ncbi:MAG: alpha-E domain-containing protein [Chloroflexota bacterium]
MLSRVADSLYWMARYLERVENTARIIHVNQNFILDSLPKRDHSKHLLQVLHSLDLEETASVEGGLEATFKRLTFDPKETGSIIQCITYARENARNVRELISTEMWTQINKLYLTINLSNPEEIWDDLPYDYYKDIVEGIYLFQGITDGTLNHSQGWHFIRLGRYLERLVALVAFLHVKLPHEMLVEKDQVQSRNYFRHAALLKSLSAYEAYCKVYTTDLRPGWMAEFLIFNNAFPRSAAFCVEMIRNSLHDLSELTGKHKNQKVNQLAGRLHSTLHHNDITDTKISGMGSFLNSLKTQAYQLHEVVYKTYVDYPIVTSAVTQSQSQSQIGR